MNKKSKRMGWIVASVVVLAAAGIMIFLNRPIFGKLPTGERLARIEQSPNYRDGKFQNRLPRVPFGADKSKWQIFRELLFRKVADRTPAEAIPTVKTDLFALPLEEDVLVWMGHSALYMHIDGKRVLVDPTLVSASPVSFFNKPFKGSDIYRPEDIPEIDYLVITHDHYDHLDYYTVVELKNRIGRVICPLAVGAHLEHWGVDPGKITELDWYDTIRLDEKLQITALPARHFSGRGLKRDTSLWASYLLQGTFGNIFLSADTGYDTHFREIKEQFGTIDLAIMENGQYNENWSDIHLMPGDLAKAIKDLDPRQVMTVHHSKYALARHPWYEPLENIFNVAEENGFPLMTPLIGEPVWLNDSTQQFDAWWRSRVVN
jgi:L-ascorbate metabolism protein UlaG (beta-lactamase superfamily)